MQIGKIELGEMPLFLAPMEDVTYKSFRYMCKKYGADVLYTEFVSSEALIRHVNKSKQKMELFDFDRPVAIQLYGHRVEAMVEAAKIVETFQPDFIDLNFGCPMKKIANRGAGAGLLQDIPKMQQMAAEVVKAVNLPVTAKTRLGWDETDKPIMEVAERLQDAGIAALAIHGRTRAQMYSGQADWSLIGAVKNNPKITIPVIGNGDINGAKKAKQFLDQTGVDGLMIGRGAIGRPWLFREVKHYLTTGSLMPLVSIKEIVENVKEQLQLTAQWRDNEKSSVLMMRRHFAKYFPGLPDFKELRISLLRAETYTDVNHYLDVIVKTYSGHRIDYKNVSLK